jgi:hypothetical protein
MNEADAHFIVHPFIVHRFNLANFLHESAANDGGLANGVCEGNGGP